MWTIGIWREAEVASDCVLHKAGSTFCCLVAHNARQGKV